MFPNKAVTYKVIYRYPEKFGLKGDVAEVDDKARRLAREVCDYKAHKARRIVKKYLIYLS